MAGMPGRSGGPRAGAGRPKGVPNKYQGDIKAMVLGALEAAGGIEYLRDRAFDQPVAFMGLIGKVLPLQVTGANGGALQVDFRWQDAPTDVSTAAVAPIIEAAVAAETNEGDTPLLEWEAPKLAND